MPVVATSTRPHHLINKRICIMCSCHRIGATPDNHGHMRDIGDSDRACWSTNRVGRPESTSRVESADPNPQRGSSRPARMTRIGKAIRVGRPESNKNSTRGTRIEQGFESGDPNRTRNRVGRPEFEPSVFMLSLCCSICLQSWV